MFPFRNSATSVLLCTGLISFHWVEAQTGVGIDVPIPQEKLDVDGALKIASDFNNSSGAPQGGAGTIRWNGANFEGWDGSTWIDFGVDTLASVVQDDDGNTKIQVEESPNEDIIRFDLGGTERFRFQQNSFGHQALFMPNSGANTFVGNNSGVLNQTGTLNAFFGASSGAANISGSYNAFFGRSAGSSNTAGNSNTFVGNGAGGFNEQGSFNTYVGSSSGVSNAEGDRNVNVGAFSGAGSTNASRNVCLGFAAGEFNTEGYRNVYLGYRAGQLATDSNRLYIENTNSLDPLIYGEFDNDVVGINGILGVGTEVPEDELHIEGSIRMVDGNEAAGFIAVSDVNGTMVWTDPTTISTSADGDGDSSNEIQMISRSGTNAFLSNGGGTISIADNDNHSGNELQSISRTGTNLNLSHGGGTVSIADNDNNPSNELQIISRSGTNATLSNGGGTISIADNDNHSGNELQSISQSGTFVTLSHGGGTVSIADNDSNASNEIQSISRSGNTLNLSNGGGSVSLADNDNNSGNEIQSLDLAGSTLSLSLGGGSVNLSGLTDDDWTVSSNDVFLQQSGNVGIGDNTPDAKLDVNGDFQLGTNGTVINDIIKMTRSVNFPFVPAGGSLYFDITGVTGAQVGASVMISPQFDWPTSVFIGNVRISAPGTVRVQIVNNSTSGQNVVFQQYYITVIQ